VWEGGQVIAEHNGSTGAMLAEYIFAGRKMIAREGGYSGRIFFLQDRLSIRATITDGNGNIQGRQSHLPFGEDLVGTGTTDKHRFTSYERDSESGTDYAVNRQYAQRLGRFMRPDPARCSNEIRVPQSLHRYSYVLNDIVNRLDPDGLDAQKIPQDQLDDYRCSGWMDDCKGMGEKIKDLSEDLAIRLRELDPSTESYTGHAKVWAEHKNVLSDCVSKFKDKGCGPPDLPAGFDLNWAVNMASAPAPGTSSFRDFLARGGLVVIGILAGAAGAVSAFGGTGWIWSNGYWCILCYVAPISFTPRDTFRDIFGIGSDPWY
jgi:RHS repeat-associated protein